MRLVVRRAAVRLDHAGYLLRPSASGIAVAASAHAVTAFDSLLGRRARISAAGNVEDVALAPNGRLAAVIDDDGLRLLEVHRDNVRWRVVGKSYACHFAADSEAVWVVRPAAQQHGARLELRDAGNGATLFKAHLDDPFGGSAFTLAPHADPRGILVWLASPELATQTVAVTVEAGALVTQVLPHQHGYPPEPIPGSPEYLLVREGVLERRSWLDHAVRDELYWPWIDDEDLAVLALSEQYALWASRTGRLHLIDHADMSYLEEVAIEGYRPRPLREVLSSSDDPRWGTDLQQFCASGSQVVLQFGDATLVSVALEDLLP